jgi:hypothetical protein
MTPLRGQQASFEFPPDVEPVLRDEPSEDEQACPLCGSRARFKGRRNRLTIWECVDGACLVGIFEVADLVPARPRGGVT